MAGVELVANKRTKKAYKPEQKIGIKVCQELRTRGILMRPLGSVIVILPPLAINSGELRVLCRETLAAIDKVTRPH
jgi:adenosylmethionine-8-amino-7-oxononanoate aminotransferase